MNITGKITAVKDSGDKYAVAIGFGNWYNGFGKLPCKKGDQVEIEYEQNDRWKNITSLKVLESSEATDQKRESFGRDPAIIVKTDCYKMAVDLCVAGRINPEQIEAKAEELFSKINK